MDNKYGVVLFYSTSLAIRAEKVTKNARLNVKLIPTPRHLSSDCGTALRFDLKEKESIIQALKTANVDYDRICPL